MLVYDCFGIFVRMFLLAFVLLLQVLTLLTGIPDRDDAADFSTLLLGSTLGMMMMASANHLLMVFIAIEMASVPSYALAGFLKGRKQGSEAALKYVVYGASTSGIMLLRHQLAGRAVWHRLPARSGDRLSSGGAPVTGSTRFCRRHAVPRRRAWLQAGGSAVPFLVPRRVRRRRGGSRRLLIGRLERGRTGADSPRFF